MDSLISGSACPPTHSLTTSAWEGDVASVRDSFADTSAIAAANVPAPLITTVTSAPLRQAGAPRL